jgi:ketosteroid isomerase-like protein
MSDRAARPRRTDTEFRLVVRTKGESMTSAIIQQRVEDHFTGTPQSGPVTEVWVRWTACFRRIDGVWLIVHDHVSVPADLSRGQAAFDLTP